jgi:anaerobic magnesium-protoporphyrin IX monomethyl ester cyclase
VKILLATLSIEQESRGEYSPNAAYSIGLVYLHAVLEQAGHEVRLLFLNNVDTRESEIRFFSEVETFLPDLVGFQIFSMNRVSSFAAVRRLAVEKPDIRVVLGGIHVSVLYEQIVTALPWTIAVRGEADEIFPELLTALVDGEDIGSIAGIAFWRDNQVVVTEKRLPVEDLDRLPFPKHEIFFDDEPLRDTAHVITSRGCPFDCTFCCLKSISMRRCRMRSVESVVSEITRLKQLYPRLRRVQFHDDTLLLNNQRVIAFCKALIAADLGLQFICSGRIKPVSVEMLSWMERAGFTKLMFGLETGSPALLASIRKKITQADVLALFTMLKPFNFTVTTFLMCGFPGENDDTVNETIDLIKRTQHISYNCIMGVGKLWVYPGTDVSLIMKERGVISDDYWLTDRPVPYFTAEHSFEELCAFEERMMVHLSLSRILTWPGFRHHFCNMPVTIIRFLASPKNRDILTAVIREFMVRHFPGIVPVMTRIYKKISVH